MQDVINLLPESLANQIAAGEVVQRPASAVKELLENAIDAQATHIQLVVKDAGKTLIQVIDNGKGMSETDARMSFERHATSKIASTDDLFSIHTFGFRGEALASIAAVAQVDLKTKRPTDEMGTHICIEGSEVKSQEPIVCQNGTSLSIKNLFFNVPARRNFLKSNPVELKYIVEEFQRVALCNPDIHMSMHQNNLETFNLSPGNLPKRIVGIFGKSYQEHILACEEEVQHIKVSGYVGKPEAAKKTRGEQFFFANGRFIKHHYLHHAVMNAYEGLLQDGTFPFYLINIEIDPKHIDVNVHPTKTEVKFDDERTVYAIVRAAVKQALAKNGAVPSLDFDMNVNFGQLDSTPLKSTSESTSFGSKPASFNSNPLYAKQEQNLKHWEKLYNPLNNGETNQETAWEFPELPDNTPEEKSAEITFSSAANELSDVSGTEHRVSDKKSSVVQIRNRYILSQVKSGLMLIDQEAAMERILFERFLSNIEHASLGASQQLLFPRTIQLAPADFTLMIELKSEIKSLGFLIEEFGNNAIIVNGIPVDVAGVDEKEMLESFIEQFKINKTEISVSNQENAARAMAKRTASQSAQSLDEREMKALIEQLFTCSNPNYSPSGKKTIAMMNMDDIERLFN
ncbi:MAG: DNA mismatch repair endonuclease MutL [Flammeovirgaceae bacterium]